MISSWHLRVSFLIIVVGLTFSTSCGEGRKTSANLEDVKINNDTSELVLTKRQLAYLENNVSKPLVWEIFWTNLYSQDATPAEYTVFAEKLGKQIPVEIISLKGSVIVLIPILHTAVTYVKMPDGRFDFPAVADWIDGERKDESTRIKHILNSSLGWSQFLSLIKQGKLGLTREQETHYMDNMDANMQYLEINGTISLPLSMEPIYDPPSEDKLLLLEHIIKVAIYKAEQMHDPGYNVTITVPNFNLGDPRIWVLIEPKQDGGIVLDLQLNTNPREELVSFVGFAVMDTRFPRYGIQDDTVRKIKSRPFRILEYNIKGN